MPAPLSVMEVMVKIMSNMISAEVCLVEVESLPKDPQVIVANAIVTPIENNQEITD